MSLIKTLKDKKGQEFVGILVNFLLMFVIIYIIVSLMTWFIMTIFKNNNSFPFCLIATISIAILIMLVIIVTIYENIKYKDVYAANKKTSIHINPKQTTLLESDNESK